MVRLGPRSPGRSGPSSPPGPNRSAEGGPPPSLLTRTLPHRFRDAFRGIRDAYREEPNLRFHIFAASGVWVMAAALGVTAVQGLYLLGSVAMVLVAEMVNTAVERAVDLAAQGRAHGLARQAKDAAAGAVLLAVIHSAAAGWYILVLPRGVAGTAAALLAWPAQAPLEAAAGGGLLLLTTLGGVLLGQDRPL